MNEQEKRINSHDLKAYRESDVKMKSMIPGLSSNHKPINQDHLRGSRKASIEKLNKTAQPELETKKNGIYENSLSPFGKVTEMSPPKKKNIRFFNTNSTLNLLDDDQNEDKSFYVSKASINTPQNNRSKSKENYKISNIDYLFSGITGNGDESNIRSSATFDNGFNNNKESNRSTARIHRKNESLTRLQSFTKDPLNPGVNTMNTHNPITNPIPFTIQNPYIIREIQQGNYRSKSPFISVICDSVSNV